MAKKLSIKNISWLNTSFLTITPILAALGLVLHTQLFDFHWGLALLFFTMYILTGMAITGGYHRLFSHRSYKAASWLKFLYLCFGAAAFQNSAMKWSADHRRHHAKVDTEQDPYSIKEGFWYSHILWILFKPEGEHSKECPDLKKDRMLVLQDRYYIIVASLFGFLLPTLIGYAFGDALGGLVYGGLLRVVVVHHCTFFINSLCHFVGKQTYTDENSARDSFVMALFTYGEGYHNFHHKFQGDYRNGLRWYHFDPTKWLIALMAWFGAAQSLVKVPDEEIFKAKLRMQQKRLNQKLNRLDPILEEMRLKVESAQRQWRVKKRDYQRLKKDLSEQGRLKLQEMTYEMDKAKLEFQNNYAQYRLYVRSQLAQAKLAVS
ncbi:MAG: fatty acid desaturase [Bdellovibrionota bacterium]